METNPANVKRTRSPAYPAIGLPQAMEILAIIFRNFQGHAAPVEAVGEAVGMKAGGSSLNVRLAALKKFELLEELEGAKGAGKSYRVTNLAKDLLVLPKESPERNEALRKAALMPVIYEALWTRFGPELPSDSLIRAYLVRERNFNAHQVDGMIADFRATVEFAGLGSETPAFAAAPAATESETFGQTVQRYATMRTVPPTTTSAPGNVFTIPLEDGKFATIPYPMSPQTWDLFMQTLKLWQPRLVADNPVE
ncbi:MAG: hypothetical protein FGM15_10110 [Chthoniobacterales bacterium]|nr:hypothetical protein [Chthoniobacterales bacterium]